MGVPHVQDGEFWMLWGYVSASFIHFIILDHVRPNFNSYPSKTLINSKTLYNILLRWIYIKCQLGLCPKYDRIHDFDIKRGFRRSLSQDYRCTCRENSNDVAQQVKTTSKSTFCCKTKSIVSCNMTFISRRRLYYTWQVRTRMRQYTHFQFYYLSLKCCDMLHHCLLLLSGMLCNIYMKIYIITFKT